MSITSLLFIFMFLPLALGIYYISNESVKEYILLIISLAFYSLGSLNYMFLFIISISFTVLIGRTMNCVERIIFKRGLLLLGILFNIAFLFYFKYFNFTISTWARMASVEVELKEILLPLGISFYTFKAISYLADIYTGKSELEENFVHDLLYLSFFSQIQSGPITRYNDCKRIDNSIVDVFSDGAIRFMIGFNKKVLIANVLANITNEIFNAPFENFSTSYAWQGTNLG